MSEVLLYGAIATIAFGLGRSGFVGVGQIGTPLLALVVPPLEAVAILLPTMLVQDALSVWSYRNDWHHSHIVAVIPGMVIGTVLAWIVADVVQTDTIRIVVGVLIIALMALRWAQALPKMTLPVGIASGFAGLLVNAAAAVYLSYLLAQKLPKLTYVATAVIFFAVSDVLKIVPLLALGEFTASSLHTSALLLPFAIASSYGGVWLVRRTNERLFQHIAHALLLALAVALIVQGSLAPH